MPVETGTHGVCADGDSKVLPAEEENGKTPDAESLLKKARELKRTLGDDLFEVT
jgi:hypothetical protein